MKVLILCIDRDDDLGRKTKLKGPVVGAKEVLKAGVELATSDPSETDANAIFAGIKIYKELKEKKEIAILTGSARVGFESDMKIKKQLTEIQKTVKADGAIIVSDGKEDEIIMPVIESLMAILSVHRLSVHSGEQLKGIFYTLSSFFSRAKEDKNLAKNVFGIPGLIALSYAIFGTHGWRIVAGILSLFLIVRGLGLSKALKSIGNYMKNSFLNLSTSFFLYTSAAILFVIAAVKTTYISSGSFIQMCAKIAISTLPLFFYGILALLIGLAIDSLDEKKRAYSYLSASVGLGVLVLIARSLASWVLESTYPLSYVVVTSVLGIIVVTLIKLANKLIKE